MRLWRGTFPRAGLRKVYDNAGRTSDVLGNLGDGGTTRNYSTGIVYDSEGRVTKEQFGTDTSIYNKLFYNSRGQLAEIRVGTSYTGPTDTTADRGTIINHYSNQPGCNGAVCNASDNNGNLMRQEIRIPNSDNFTQFYEYDSLNRLKLVRESKNGGSTYWKQTYNYDRFGNRTIDQDATDTFGSGIPKPHFTINAVNNRLEVPVGQSGVMTYDAVGNLVTDTYMGTASIRTYDAENRLTSDTGTNNIKVGEYGYDGNGRRVVRNASGVVTWQVYGLGGELLAEYAENGSPASPLKEYGYRNGDLLVEATAGWGSMPVIHDNPLIVSETTIQSRHITELRAAIDALRINMGLQAYSWQHLAAIGALIKADPILEMRSALDQALGTPSGEYSAGLTQGLEIKAIHIQELRDRVTAAWSIGSSVQIRWLVKDHLGTPRMIFNQSGSLASARRHDYLPFGEELLTGRETTPGYGSADKVRQRFTSYERDDETNLDYAQNRYYSLTMGRFTTVDPANTGSIPSLPQSWNGYSYVHNRPTFYVDPDGLKIRVCDNAGNCGEISDEEAKNYLFNKEYASRNGFVTDGYGNVWDHNGQMIGTYTRTSFDDLSDQANEFLFQVMRRTAPIPRATLKFAEISVKLGTRLGIGWAGEDIYSILQEPTSSDLSIGTMPTASGELYLSQGDHNYLGFVLNSDKGEIQIFARSVTQQGDTLIIDDLSIQGAGANTVGLSSTRQYARDIGKAFGAKEVIIQGGQRTTGANPGRTPVPIRIKVN